MTIEQPLRLSDGTVIYVEVEAEDFLKQAIGQSAAGDDLAEPSRRSGGHDLEEVGRVAEALKEGAKAVGEVAEVNFAKAVGMVECLARDLSGAFAKVAADQAEVELALKIKGGGDIKLVKAMAEYDMKVKLTWKFPRPGGSGAPVA